MIPGRAEQSIEQHRAIVEALKNRDPDLAAKLMSDHITTAGEQIVTFVRRQSGEIRTSAMKASENRETSRYLNGRPSAG